MCLCVCDLKGKYSGLGSISLLAEHVECWAKVHVDDFVKNENCLRYLFVFMLKYCYYATPKNATNKKIMLEQCTVYLENPDKETTKNFKCHIQYFSQNDQAWPIWQYINNIDDW